jgi:Nif-specific regulatory protein
MTGKWTMTIGPAIESAAAQLLEQAATAKDAAEYLRQALAVVAQAAAAPLVTVVKGEKGQWRTLGSFGFQRPLPTELLADVLDQARPVSTGDWIALPLFSQAESGEAVAAWQAKERGELASLIAPLRSGLKLVRSRDRQSQRIALLQAILTIAAQWHETPELESLLAKMAETATRLLSAERASIFLWDQANRTLVGRPALGVAGNELRIPDDTGIVGQVVHSGQPRRVDADVGTEQREIDRRVDQQLKYETRTLHCVPQVGRKG